MSQPSAKTPKRLRVRVADDESREAPAVVFFPNGRLESKDLAFSLTRPPVKRKASHRTLATETKELKYEATHKPNVDERHYKYMLAVRKPGEDALTLVKTRLFYMRPQFQGENVDEGDRPDSPTKRAQARAQLVATFGGKRKRAELSAQIRNKVSDEALTSISGIMGQALDSARESGNLFGDNGQKDHETLNLPPFDKAASTPADAYPADKIITKADLKAINPMTKTFIKAGASDLESWQSQNKYPSFIMDGLSRMTEMTAQQRTQTARFTVLVNELLKFYRTIPTGKRFKIHEVAAKTHASGDLVSKFVGLFMHTDDTKDTDNADRLYQMSSRKQDLLLNYLFVCILHINGFEGVDIDNIATELKLTRLKVSQHFKAIGCATEVKRRGDVSKRVAKLNIPLTFPKPSRGGRK